MARDVIVERKTYGTDYGHRAATGPARMFATIFGIAYLVVAAAEVYLWYVGESLIVNGYTLLSWSLVHNIVHWATALVLLGAAMAVEWNSKAIVRGLGVVFTLLALFGFVAPATLGTILGFSGNIPMAYNWVHLVTGVLALVAGFVSPSTGRTRRVARQT